MFRSSIASAKRAAKAATTTRIHAVSETVATTNAWARGSSDRTLATSRINAASGKTPR